MEEQGLDPSGVVVIAGSFSKVLFPSIRLGYFVVPVDLVDRVAAMKSVPNRHASVLEQVVLCDFIEQGHFGRHVRRMTEVYRERLDVLVESAHQRLSDLREISNGEAGLQTVGWLQGNGDAEFAPIAAAERGVEITPPGSLRQREVRPQWSPAGIRRDRLQGDSPRSSRACDRARENEKVSIHTRGSLTAPDAAQSPLG